MKDITTVVTALLATISTAAADPRPAARPAPTDPKLAQLVGRWEGTSKFTLRGQTSTWKLTYTCERAAVGPAITCAVLGTSGKDWRYEEAHLFGYDKASGTYHLFSVNDWGEAYDHAATWTNASKVSFEHRGTRNGKELREVYSYTFSGNQLVVEGALTVGGHVIGQATSALKRVP